MRRERKRSGRGKEDTNSLYGKQESPFKIAARKQAFKGETVRQAVVLIALRRSLMEHSIKMFGMQEICKER